MHEFDLINNYFFKIAKKNKSALNLNDDVFFDKKKVLLYLLIHTILVRIFMILNPQI